MEVNQMFKDYCGVITIALVGIIILMLVGYWWTMDEFAPTSSIVMQTTDDSYQLGSHRYGAGGQVDGRIIRNYGSVSEMNRTLGCANRLANQAAMVNDSLGVHDWQSGVVAEPFNGDPLVRQQILSMKKGERFGNPSGVDGISGTGAYSEGNLMLINKGYRPAELLR